MQIHPVRPEWTRKVLVGPHTDLPIRADHSAHAAGRLPRVRAGRRRRILLVVVTLAAVVGLCQCQPKLDPDTFGVQFKNDLHQPVRLALCKSDHSEKCDDPSYRERIVAGGALEENVGVDVRTEWAIELEDGELLRCVVLYWPRDPGHDVQISLTSAPSWANPCPDSTPAATERA